MTAAGIGHPGREEFSQNERMGKLIRAVGVGLTVMLLVTGCSNVVKGDAARAATSIPDDVPPLREAQLKSVLLSAEELNALVGSSTMEVVSDVDEFQDNSAYVSDTDCLGSVYGAEKQVYGTGWDAMRDQVVREPGDDNEYWSEQTVVLYPSSDEAQAFVEDSAAKWADCAGSAVAVDDSDGGYTWEIGDSKPDGDLVTQVVAQEDADGWNCQHTLASVSNVVVETMVCAFGVGDQGAQMSIDIIDNIVETAG